MEDTYNCKCKIGDVVVLKNGKIREIKHINISIAEDYFYVEYQGKWFTPFFSESSILRKI